MEEFLLQLSSGLASGAIYASLALALVMIYQSTHNINFAQGEMATFSTFLAWSLMELGLSYWVAFLCTIAIAFVGGFAVQRIFLKPVEKASSLTNVIVFIALMLIFNGLSGWLFGYTVKPFPSPFPTDSLLQSRYLSSHQIGSIGAVLIVMAILFTFLRFTSIGLALRGAATNPDSARLVGIRVSWALALGWGMAAAIGSVAGMMIAPTVYLDPSMMSGVLLYGFAGALVGGISNPWGAVVGGFAVGVLENLLGAFVIGTDLKLTVALVLIVGTLTLKPNGLFGKVVVARV